MPIPTIAAAPLPTVLPSAPDGREAGAPGTEVAGRPVARSARAEPDRRPAAETATEVFSDPVRLSEPQASGARSDSPAAVFAEIWKNGRKIAEVDMHGGVTALNGAVLPFSDGAGAGGTTLAARVASQVARTLGGEIRVAGQLVDGPTLTMRERLRAAYGSAGA